MSSPHDLPIFRPRFGSGRKPGAGTGGASFRNAVQSTGRLFGGRKANAPTARSRVAVMRPTASARRVIVKAHVVKLTASGAKAAALHLRYIERDGVEKDGSKGVLYGTDGPVRRETFEEPRLAERHQFRLIVSPEDGGELDMTAYVRQFMARVEKDLGRKLEWAAVNHHDTDHPHSHIVVRGVDRDGHEVRLDRAYISNGMRWRAQEVATEELGPRPARNVERARDREIAQERFTTLDRAIERASKDHSVDPASLRERDRSVLVARLEHLEHLGLAHRGQANAWTLATGWQERLRDLGSRGDILKQIHAAMAGDPSRYRVVRPGEALPAAATHSVIGRVAAKGLSDELKGSFYAIVETPDGHGYHVPVDPRSADTLRIGDVVSLATRSDADASAIDRRLAERAHRGGGVVVPKRSGDISSEERRLRELESFGLVTRSGPSAWRVPPDLLQRLDLAVGPKAGRKSEGHADAKSARHRPRHRILLRKQPVALGAQVHRPGPVWLDRLRPENLAPYGFGADLRRLVEKRREMLRRLGVEPDDPQRAAKLRALELRAIGQKIAAETGQRFVEVPPPGFRGRVQLPETASSTYAVVSDGSRFVVVRSSSTVRASEGMTVTLARDPKGRVTMRKAPDKDREP